MIPLGELPGPMASIGELLPAAALSTTLQAALRDGADPAGSAWVVLVLWAVAAPLVATRVFRWDP